MFRIGEKVYTYISLKGQEPKTVVLTCRGGVGIWICFDEKPSMLGFKEADFYGYYYYNNGFVLFCRNEALIPLAIEAEKRRIKV